VLSWEKGHGGFNASGGDMVVGIDSNSTPAHSHPIQTYTRALRDALRDTYKLALILLRDAEHMVGLPQSRHEYRMRAR